MLIKTLKFEVSVPWSEITSYWIGPLHWTSITAFLLRPRMSILILITNYWFPNVVHPWLAVRELRELKRRGRIFSLSCGTYRPCCEVVPSGKWESADKKGNFLWDCLGKESLNRSEWSSLDFHKNECIALAVVDPQHVRHCTLHTLRNYNWMLSSSANRRSFFKRTKALKHSCNLQ